MDWFDAFGHRCSKFVLGAAQLGMEYGVMNRTGQPSIDNARQLVETAYERGVTVIDTASAYGESENVIGAILRENAALKHDFLVITKLSPLEGYQSWDVSYLRRAVRNSVEGSLRKLGLDRLDLLLFHRTDQITFSDGLVLDMVLELVNEGKIGAIGASVYNPPEADMAVSSGRIDALQIPFNVLDHRFITTGIVERARSKGVRMFARSALLQGIVPAAPEKIPDRLTPLRHYISRFHELANSWNRSPADAAIAFVRGCHQIDGIVVGMELLEQLEENLMYFSSSPLDSGQTQAIFDAFPELPEHLINPSKWPVATE